MTYRHPRRATPKALLIGLAVFAVWCAWAYRDAIGNVIGGWW